MKVPAIAKSKQSAQHTRVTSNSVMIVLCKLSNDGLYFKNLNMSNVYFRILSREGAFYFEVS